MTEPERGSAGSILAMAGPLLLAAVATAVGARVLARRIPSAWYAAAIVGLLLFFALFTFKQTRGWNTGLLAAFAGVAGGFAGAFFPQTAGWGGMVAGGLLGLAGLVSRGSWAAGALTGRLCWMLSWVYVAGWPILLLIDAPGAYLLGWAAGGLAIFVGLASCWLAAWRWQGSARQTGTPAAIELYLIALNLLLAGSAVIEWLG